MRSPALHGAQVGRPTSRIPQGTRQWPLLLERGLGHPALTRTAASTFLPLSAGKDSKMSQAPATPSRTPSAGDPRTREFRGSISLRVLELTEPSGRGPGRARSSPHAGAASPTSQGPLCGASLALAPRTELSGQPLQTPPDPGPLRLASYPELSAGGRLAGTYGAPDAGFCGGH